MCIKSVGASVPSAKDRSSSLKETAQFNRT